MKPITCLPSKKLQRLVNDIHGSPHAAAQAWDIPTTTLMRFLEQGIDAPIPTRIMVATGLKYEDVVEHKEQ